MSYEGWTPVQEPKNTVIHYLKSKIRDLCQHHLRYLVKFK